ncbi:hypothetical protein BD414DRAFT_486083 [Trametes punicea]|nr:hypothetical protein BD414DRAFT_486083 [Trametes punicea]
MAKRPKVPTALHSELTEYASLLRALRTSNILDLAQHLTGPPPPAFHSTSVLNDGSLPDDEVPGHVEDPPLTNSVSRDLVSEVASSVRSRASSQTRERSSAAKGKQKDTWTRWPLLAGDVHVPEWGLHDEVLLVAQQVLVSLNNSSWHPQENRDAEGVVQKGSARIADAIPALSDEEASEHPALSPVALRALTSASAAFVTRLLALLAAHVPNAEKSMQNRIRPINWETVIDVACANGVVSAETAEHVRARMARLYPPSRPSITHRIARLATMQNGLAELLSQCDASLLTVPGERYSAKAAPRKVKRSAQEREGSAEVSSSTKRRRSEDG